MHLFVIKKPKNLHRQKKLNAIRVHMNLCYRMKIYMYTVFYHSFYLIMQVIAEGIWHHCSYLVMLVHWCVSIQKFEGRLKEKISNSIFRVCILLYYCNKTNHIHFQFICECQLILGANLAPNTCIDIWYWAKCS